MVFIKRLSISGFKSYKDATDVGPFDQKHTAVVGRNGAGKSNFFAAIRFVLSDTYTQMRSEERQQLLHEGAGAHMMSAQVEIVFDNSDGRFPIDRDEVSIRRQIGLKKDEFFLDNKYVQKQEIVSLLESAGFSRSNPYYIVQQGKVKELTTMKDSQRLDLLKEVAGTRVYDERRKESAKLMAESDDKIAKIKELIQYIDERLGELEGEKDELKEYQRLDKDRRALEYAIYDGEYRGTMTELAAIDERRKEESEKTTKAFRQSDDARDQLKAAERSLKAVRSEIATLTSAREVALAERQALIRSRAKLELEVRDTEDALDTTRKQKKKLTEERNTLKKRIDAAQAELVKARPAAKAQTDDVFRLEQQMDINQRRTQEMYSKQGRKSQFSTAAERDKWIAAESKTIEATLATERKQLQALDAEVKKLRDVITKLTRDLEEQTAGVEERRRQVDVTDKDITAKKLEVDTLQNERKEMWRKDNELDQKLNASRAELVKLDRDLTQAIPKNVAAGLTACQRLAAEHHVNGVYGPLLELFDCPPRYTCAVETTAGGSLFHVVVDNDQTAAKMVELLKAEDAGRVTFLPLNVLTGKEAAVPEQHKDDATSLLSKLTFSPLYRKAMVQTFGKTLVVRTMESGKDIATQYDVNCITLDGDLISRRGAVVGGYIDRKTSRLDVLGKIKKERKSIEDQGKESDKLKRNIEEINQTITQRLSEIAKLQSRRDQLATTQEAMASDRRTTSSDLAAKNASLEEKIRSQQQLRSTIEKHETSLAGLSAELGTPLTSTLSPAEQKELQQLNQELDAMRQQLIDAMRAQTEVSTRVNTLDAELNMKLLKRETEVEAELQQLSEERRADEHDLKQHELENVNQSLERLDSAIKQHQAELDEKTARLRAVETSVEDLKTSQTATERNLQEESKEWERLMNKRTLLVQKKEECMKKIRDLGSLPADAQKYASESVKELLKKLHKVNEALKKYSHVNKKALDQFMTFSDQRTHLTERLDDSENSAKSIRDLIETLDQRKDEAIERTFKQVGKNFSEVFRELMPTGSAKLKMQEDDQPDSESMSQSQSQPQQRKTGMKRFSGVVIEVQFAGSAQTQAMHQLSGGQKSLVALALIFAIQRCDPAPFYLFDEIDSALDAAHRTAVASLIRKQTESAQFITTTFRQELVQHADMCFEVIYANKVSRIDQVSTERALEVIHKEEQEEQAAGK
eukprot:TRINITY_DN13345_c0_g1_i1.p1 TRINITY_DN13345_c0_g1~~TRINITY_DN13345_c0_g1_i1.p1  ORF type:complete len:1206 (+),score=342.11 TRINITY_DN13345_c0_g1_i1:115-3732(+)